MLVASHTETLYKHSDILKISDLYQLEAMLFMHDYTRDNLPTSFQNVFRINRDVHGIYQTRRAHLFYIPWTNPDLLTNFQSSTFQILGTTGVHN